MRAPDRRSNLNVAAGRDDLPERILVTGHLLRVSGSTSERGMQASARSPIANLLRTGTIVQQTWGSAHRQHGGPLLRSRCLGPAAQYVARPHKWMFTTTEKVRDKMRRAYPKPSTKITVTRSCGFFSKHARCCAGSASHPNRKSRMASRLLRMNSIATPSFRHGPISSTGLVEISPGCSAKR
jgi:hypothetical protein